MKNAKCRKPQQTPTAPRQPSITVTPPPSSPEALAERQFLAKYPMLSDTVTLGASPASRGELQKRLTLAVRYGIQAGRRLGLASIQNFLTALIAD
jgi:hypothetical protein